MRTFTFSDAKSHKFWNIEFQGVSFTVTYGRQGTAGQTQTKTFATEAAAQKEHDKLVKEKLAKGYVETTPSAKPRPSSVREALEAALIADPDDLSAHMAYADHLAEIGDPRGEFIQVQLALEDPAKPAAERKKLAKREQALLKEHGRAWLGELAPFLLDQEGIKEYQRPEGVYSLRLRRGWLDRLDTGGASFAFGRALARAPQSALLRELVVRGQAYEGGEDRPADAEDIPEDVSDIALFPLLRSRYLGNVRLLQLGEQEPGDEYFNCSLDADPAVGLVKLMPRLEELYLLAHRVDTPQLFGLKTLHNLRVLQVYHMDNYPLPALAKNPSLGRLTHLLLFPHNAEEDEPYIRLTGVRALLRSTTLTSLTHLQISASDMGDPGCEEIVRSGILKRLKMLDVRWGRITDEGARVLAACADLPHLERLDLTGNALTTTGIEALQATGVQVRAQQQWTSSGNAEDDYQHYLFQGDIE